MPKTEFDDEMVSALPGVRIPKDKFVVLTSRLGHKQESLPKRDPNDPNEETKYFTPDPYERGEVISLSDLWIDPTGEVDNITRLIRIGAIARLDHPEASEAINGLEYRRNQERKVAEERGFSPR